MQAIGKLVRWLLNINTLWGLMILATFVLCAAQHYLPTTTVIAAERLHEGTNTLRIRIADSKGVVQDHDYSLTRDGGKVTLPAAGAGEADGAPWLLSCEMIGAGCVVRWDTSVHGTYEVWVNAAPVATGRLVTLQSLTDAAFDYATIGFDIALGLVAAMVLFLGLMKVGEDAGIVQLVARVFYPVIRFLFPDVPKDHPASGAILMNWTTTLLGLGNAATPFGLKAMKELQSLNPHPEVASDSQVMLLGYNTAGLAILPTTLLAVRKSAGCRDPFEIIGTCLFAGLVATVTAIVMVKLLGRLPVFSVRAALAEQAREAKTAAGEGE